MDKEPSEENPKSVKLSVNNNNNESGEEEEDDSFSEKDPVKPNSLLGRRNTGNNLFLKIPANDPDTMSSDSDGEDDGKGGSGNLSNYRRNSISMPVLNTMDLDALRQLHDKAVQEKMDNIDDTASVQSSSRKSSVAESSSASSSTDEDADKPSKRQMLFRTKRRSSIAPLPALRLNGEILANEMDSQSIITQNSITSLNSLASLLREKLQYVPSFIRKKREKTREFKVKAFVAFLFLFIVFLVSYAYVMYDYKVISKMYFERVKFSQASRSFKLFNPAKDSVVIRGSLGLQTNLGPKPVRCTTADLNELCFEWGGKAKLLLSETELTASIRCYNVHWRPLDEHIRPMDCFKMEDGVHWYGGGLAPSGAWPLEEEDLSLSPFITGNHHHYDGHRDQSAWGNVAKRYFINSNGIAIEVREESPLYVSINANRSREFCMKSRYDDFAFANRLTKFPELAYRICSGAPDVLSLHQHLATASLWDGLRENEVNLMHTLMEEPVWQVTDPASGGGSSASAVERYTDAIIGMGFVRLGHVLFDAGNWQKNVGDFTVDEERYPQFGEMVNVLHRRGFKVALAVPPFISTKSPMFAEAVQRRLLIAERQSEGAVPALTKYQDYASVGVLDVTNEEALPWLLDKLNRLVDEYKVNGFYLELGSASDMPRYYQTNYAIRNPDDYKRIFMQKVDGLLNVIGVSSAVEVPNPPTFVSLQQASSSWRGLRTTMMSVLSHSVLGYPFLLSNAIGGDFFRTAAGGIPLAFLNQSAIQLPDEELFIRWLQLATFLPAMKFTYLPSHFAGDQVTEVASALFAIRHKFVIPTIKKYLADAINEATPLIRPLWMLDPQDSTGYTVQDQFAIGPEIIVAPVLHKGAGQREVYLPHGVWKDGIDGSLRKGSRWIHNYQVALDKVAYFIKMPDNTRF